MFATHFPLDFIAQGANIHFLGFDFVDVLTHYSINFFIDFVFFTHVFEDGAVDAADHQIIVGDDVDGWVLLDHFEDPVTQVFDFVLAQPHGRLQLGSGLLPIEFVIPLKAFSKVLARKKGLSIVQQLGTRC